MCCDPQTQSCPTEADECEEWVLDEAEAGASQPWDPDPGDEVENSLWIQHEASVG
jgi:hypothetical protein